MEELHQMAEENTQRIDGHEIKSMAEAMSDIIRKECPDGFDCDGCMAEFSDGVPMYVLSNRNGIEGAACMLYASLLRDFAEETGSSFYVIPSSVHEVLLLPAENLNGSGEIKGMIKEINDNHVQPDEILSYSLYYYDRVESRLCIC